ncbi:MAG: hypothetical protein ABR999_03375 [Methanoregula sp.]|uniref:hypothetical protein n=1 Tax=Methanoregula sp. TaxID=2052170 RepID=UPI003D143867
MFGLVQLASETRSGSGSWVSGCPGIFFVRNFFGRIILRGKFLAGKIIGAKVRKPKIFSAEKCRPVFLANKNQVAEIFPDKNACGPEKQERESPCLPL